MEYYNTTSTVTLDPNTWHTVQIVGFNLSRAWAGFDSEKPAVAKKSGKLKIKDLLVEDEEV